MSTKYYRYGLPKRAIKGDCPQCGPKHRRTLSRYVDSHTGKVLPEEFGRCDRENNCGYYLSPYQPGPWGRSYANEVFEQWKAANPLPAGYTRQPKRYRSNPPIGEAVEQPIHTIPAEVFQQTLCHYDANQFAVLLRCDFGRMKADESG